MNTKPLASILLLLLPLCATVAAPPGLIELAGGARIQGEIIEQTSDTVTIRTEAGGRELVRKYPLNRVALVITDGKTTYSAQPAATSSAPPGAGAAHSGFSAGLAQRTIEQVEALIEQSGKTAPPWLEKTPLEYPRTLDLSWPDSTHAVWNYTRHIDHYIWDIINTNPSRYRLGVRLMHHLLEVHPEPSDARARVTHELGRMYFEFFNDYARAAYWWRKAAATPVFEQTAARARLAECYWRLGNREHAVNTLEAVPLSPAAIKLWGDLKETDKALELAGRAIEQGMEASELFLLAGDACRAAERYEEAIGYYQRALAVPGSGRLKEEVKRNHDRARATIEVIELFDKLDVSQLGDGTFEAHSYGYAGNVHVETVTRRGRIDALRVTSLSDKQYYHAVEETVKRIVDRQSVKGVDAISGATITSEAVIRATAKALGKAMPAPESP